MKFMIYLKVYIFVNCYSFPTLPRG